MAALYGAFQPGPCGWDRTPALNAPAVVSARCGRRTFSAERMISGSSPFGSELLSGDDNPHQRSGDRRRIPISRRFGSGRMRARVHTVRDDL